MKASDLLGKLDPSRDPGQETTEVPAEGSGLRGVMAPKAFLALIELMVENPNTYGWAYETLAGIRETVEKTQLVTEGQRSAVYNIRHAGEEQEARQEEKQDRGRRDGDGYYRNYRGGR